MTLKSQTSELSKKAKAFSVENLLSVRRRTEDGREKLKCGPNVETKSGITVELCCNELWERFNSIGTEMIVTRAGRRMFPTLKVRLKGLTPSARYIVYMDVIPIGEAKYRYNYQRSEWMVVGPSNSFSLRNIYVHPDSPATGDVWNSRKYVSFEKVKLTNNKRPFMKDQVSLHSMHKYQPRIHLLEVPEYYIQSENVMDYIHKNLTMSKTFSFEQTAFFTVTAYQNQKITALKIQSNPFAKGFRETLNTRKENRESCVHGSQCLPKDFVHLQL